MINMWVTKLKFMPEMPWSCIPEIPPFSELKRNSENLKSAETGYISNRKLSLVGKIR